MCASSVTQSYLTLATLWTVVSQTPLSMGFSRQEYRSGLPFPLHGIFLTQGSNMCPTLAGGFFTTEPPGKHSGPLKYLPHIPLYFINTSLLVSSINWKDCAEINYYCCDGHRIIRVLQCR